MNVEFPRAYRLRVICFLAGVVVVLILLSVVYRGINTLNRLEVVESERDQWQRSAEVLQALDLRDGSVVVDLGCGAGFFSLKLAHAVGNRGRVIAVDIRRLPLLFLWLRARLRNLHNASVVHGDAETLGIPAGTVDALLVANTYHEFRNRKAILDRAFQSLTPGGRLVILDRSPSAVDIQHDQHEGNEHELPAATVQQELLQSGFEISSREDRFTGQPAAQSWWLITARKP